MAERIESIIASCHNLLFPEAPQGINDDKQILKLSALDVSWFVTVQVCLPILTGIISTVLYEKWKSINNKSEAEAAIQELKSYIEKDRDQSSVVHEVLRKDVANILHANGFSPEESPEVADRLIETIKTDLQRAA